MDAAVELAHLQWKMVEDSENYAKLCKNNMLDLKKQHREDIAQIHMQRAKEIEAMRFEHAKAFDANLLSLVR